MAHGILHDQTACLVVEDVGVKEVLHLTLFRSKLRRRAGTGLQTWFAIHVHLHRLRVTLLQIDCNELQLSCASERLPPHRKKHTQASNGCRC